ncbi:MAG TPA: hypothetical protein VJN18_09010 [Polyangiaceae bacterium]|nr:hypothetical protein [Polyangiaceae bacterium]
MARPPYPLEALRKLRDDQADAQTRALAEQVARSADAERLLHERAAARRAQAQETRDSLARVQARLLTSGASAAELRRVAEFETAMRAQAALLERAENEARKALGAARAAEEQLRQELARREADAQLVRNHETSFLERAAEQAARTEEEAALEQWNARRR